MQCQKGLNYETVSLLIVESRNMAGRDNLQVLSRRTVIQPLRDNEKQQTEA